ncbi:MAG: putative inorganic carbon transporter subunit DabA [Paraperlucidibaca sp.]
MNAIAALHLNNVAMPLSASAQVAEVAATLAPLWPIATFAARSPWLGLEHDSFAAVAAYWPSHAGESMLPFGATERQALAADPALQALMNKSLSAYGVTSDELLHNSIKPSSTRHDPAPPSPSATVDGHVIRWLKLYVGAPGASWSLPGAQQGLFKAWRRYALVDPLLPKAARRVLAKGATSSDAALAEVLERLPVGTNTAAFISAQLLALPGWAGALAYQAKTTGRDELLLDYVALRAQTAWALAGQSALAVSAPEHATNTAAAALNKSPALSSQALGLMFLQAREQRYLHGLKLAFAAPHSTTAGTDVTATGTRHAPARVQMVLCIDVRSEPLRRALEQHGRIETFGAAGFFGLAVQRQALDGQHTHANCPVIVAPAFAVRETAEARAQQHYLTQIAAQQALNQSVAHIKQHPLGALTAPEVTGLWQALTLITQTLPARVKDHLQAVLPLRTTTPQTTTQVNSPVAATHSESSCTAALPQGMSLTQQIDVLHGFLCSIGLVREFAALVVIAGHGSHSENNHYAAKLDCGACGGASGRFNAHILATIGNDPAVRAALASKGIDIPVTTQFVAAEHQTSRDQLVLEPLPDALSALNMASRDAYAHLQAILPAALGQLQAERLAALPDHQYQSLTQEAARRASDWREVRPEWGLANNAAFIIGPRALTASANLHGRSFLHSYDWQLDPDGALLRGIIAGPGTVTQWINLQYYASTTLPVTQGSGSKTTQTLTAGFGVMQGNGSDLLPGLPWQAVMRSDHSAQHEAIRLRLVILAPETHVAQLLASAADLQRKVSHGWLLLSSQCPISKIWSDWQ